VNFQENISRHPTRFKAFSRLASDYDEQAIRMKT